MSYLEHHGIKGMRWGVRRYRNEDGSLTPAGQKRYDKMAGEKLYKDLKKQIRKQRGKQSGFSNKWLSQTPIGENSKKVIDESRTKQFEYENSKEYKQWKKKMNKVDKLDESDDDKYNDLWTKTVKEMPKRNFNSLNYAYISGYGFCDDFLNKGGRDLSIAYIKDLGYNEQVAKNFVDKITKTGKSLGTI